MDQLSANGTARDGVLARRKQRRADARGRRHADGAVPDRFQTPQWLERSFVLPLTDGGVTVVPSQSQPHHDDFAATPLAEGALPRAEVGHATSPTFVRPPSSEIDFARMIKRSDHCRMASRAAIASIGFAGLAVVIFLLTMEPVALTGAIVCVVLAAIAVAVRFRLATAPVPHLQR